MSSFMYLLVYNLYVQRTPMIEAWQQLEKWSKMRVFNPDDPLYPYYCEMWTHYIELRLSDPIYYYFISEFPKLEIREKYEIKKYIGNKWYVY